MSIKLRQRPATKLVPLPLCKYRAVLRALPTNQIVGRSCQARRCSFWLFHFCSSRLSQGLNRFFYRNAVSARSPGLRRASRRYPGYTPHPIGVNPTWVAAFSLERSVGTGLRSGSRSDESSVLRASSSSPATKADRSVPWCCCTARTVTRPAARSTTSTPARRPRSTS